MEIGDVVAAEYDASIGERDQAADEIDDGALAGAVGPDQAKNFALRYGEIDVVDGAVN